MAVPVFKSLIAKITKCETRRGVRVNSPFLYGEMGFSSSVRPLHVSPVLSDFRQAIGK